jgi:hypothetical protein
MVPHRQSPPLSRDSPASPSYDPPSSRTVSDIGSLVPTVAATGEPLPSFDTYTTTDSYPPLSTSLTSRGSRSALITDTPDCKFSQTPAGQQDGVERSRGEAEDGYFGTVLPLIDVSQADAVNYVDAGRKRRRVEGRGAGYGRSWLGRAGKFMGAIGRSGVADGAADSTPVEGMEGSAQRCDERQEKPFSMYGAVCLATCCLNTWVVGLLGLDAGLRYGGPTARESSPSSRCIVPQGVV